MGDVLISLLGLCMGILVGAGAGMLAAAGIPFLQDRSPIPLGDGPATLVALAVVGAALGIIVGILFEHPSVLLGALVSLLYFAHALLRPKG